MILLGSLYTIILKHMKIQCYGVVTDLSCGFGHRMTIIVFDLIFKEASFVVLPAYYIWRYAKEEKKYLSKWYIGLSLVSYLGLMLTHPEDKLLYGSF